MRSCDRSRVSDTRCQSDPIQTNLRLLELSHVAQAPAFCTILTGPLHTSGVIKVFSEASRSRVTSGFADSRYRQLALSRMLCHCQLVLMIMISSVSGHASTTLSFSVFRLCPSCDDVQMVTVQTTASINARHAWLRWVQHHDCSGILPTYVADLMSRTVAKFAEDCMTRCSATRVHVDRDPETDSRAR